MPSVPILAGSKTSTAMLAWSHQRLSYRSCLEWLCFFFDPPSSSYYHTLRSIQQQEKLSLKSRVVAGALSWAAIGSLSLNMESQPGTSLIMLSCGVGVCYMYSKHILISENWNHHSYSNTEVWETSYHLWNYRHVVKRRKNKGNRVISKYMNQSKFCIY